MTLSIGISNIAWEPSEEPQIAALLERRGVQRVEVAPTRIAASPETLAASDLRRYREFWQDHGIRIAAIQALLFGRPDLTLFGDHAARERTIEHLLAMIGIAVELAASVLVFGSPANRRVAGVPESQVRAIEKEFFGAIGDAAAQAGVFFCVEPNPPEYGCDYINTVDEARALMSRVGSPGLGIHLDSGSLAMSGEPLDAIERIPAADIRHVHASEPQLAPVGSGGMDHAPFAALLRRIGYDGVVSIEMRPSGNGEQNIERVERALEFAHRVYAPRMNG